MALSLGAASVVGRRLIALSARPERAAAPKRHPLTRLLRLVGVSLVALYSAMFSLAVGVGEVADALPQSPVAIGALALAQAAPVVLVLYRPIAAWWLSLVIMLPYMIMVGLVAGPAPDLELWPFSGGSIVTHLFVGLVVAYQSPAPVYLSQWLITAALAGAAEVVFPGRTQTNDGLTLLILYAVGLGGVAIAHRLREARRELRHQVDLTEQERHQRTALEERTRIARELHDVVAHHMSVIAVQAEAAPYRVSGLDPVAAESFASIRQNALAAMTEMRQILGMLRSDDDSENRYAPQPTLADLDQLFDNCRSAGLTLTTGVRGTVRELPRQVELIAYRVIQEALSNAIRHARGADVEVDVEYGPAELRLRVANSPSPAAGRLSRWPPQATA